MKILILTERDYANFAYDFVCSLKSIGIDCRGLKLEAHRFVYNKQLEIVDVNSMISIAMGYDIVICVHGRMSFFSSYYNKLKHKIHYVYYTGSLFRNNPEKHMEFFNKHVERSIVALPEFWKYDLKNKIYMVGSVDIDKYKFIDNTNDLLEIAHYPSDPIIKGTSSIVKMMSNIRGDYSFICNTKQENNEIHIKRLQHCDVYIELFNTHIGDKEYGSWGITALEAASLGKIVITMCTNNNVYLDHYDNTGLIICNTEKDFISRVSDFVKMDKKEIDDLKIKTRQWVIDNHAYKTTGRYFIEKIVL